MQRYALYALFIVAISLSACYPTIHFPQRINNPGFREKGEAKLSTAMVLHEDDTAPDKHLAPAVDAAYAITKHMGVMASYRSVTDKRLMENSIKPYGTPKPSLGGKFDGRYMEAGAGYFMNFSALGQIEVYAGGGIGTIKRQGYVTPQYDFSSRYYKLFIQPAFNVTPGLGRYFKVGTGMRFAVVDYYDFNAADASTRYVLTSTERPDSRKRDVAAAPFVYAEPFINVEAGYKFIKLNVQLSGSTAISEIDMGGGPCLSFGLVFSYAERYFKRNTAKKPAHSPTR